MPGGKTKHQHGSLDHAIHNSPDTSYKDIKSALNVFGWRFKYYTAKKKKFENC